MEKLILNAAQRVCLEFYAAGDYQHLINIKTVGKFKTAIDECGDSLLQFLLDELATSEDCDCIETALNRLDAAIEDIEAVKRNLSSYGDGPWESVRIESSGLADAGVTAT